MAESDENAGRSRVPTSEFCGRVLGDFILVRPLGQGGFGHVYLATQRSLKREVAVKILRGELAGNLSALARFRAEAEAIATLNHPHIVQVYAVGEEGGLHYMALEYVPGRDLRQHLELHGVLSAREVVSVVRQVASALQRASALGLVHRDIKPENILVTRGLEVKVADFGLSRYFGGAGADVSVTQSGMTLGTPLYMSPEQVRGEPLDHGSDLYSLGVTAYQMLVGEPPFVGGNAFELASKHVHADPVPLRQHRPELPAALCAVIHKLLAKRSEDRYRQATDLLADLAAIPDLGTLSPLLLPSATVSRSEPRPRRAPSRRLGLAISGVLVFAVAGYLSSIALRRAAPTITTDPQRQSTAIVSPYFSATEVSLRQQLIAATAPKDILRLRLDLACQLLGEQRLDEAEAEFRALESTPASDPARSLPLPYSAVGKLGRSIVLSLRNQTRDSTALIDATLTGVPRAALRAGVEKLCFEYGEFGWWLGVAANRNAEGFPREAKTPNLSEWLRSPRNVLRGPSA